ncbi:MAG: hypothetical protein ED558_16460 [Oricola sp.]|nr:MAG: hypothetical protein ED558_16460 [Oricola sp.]
MTKKSDGGTQGAQAGLDADYALSWDRASFLSEMIVILERAGFDWADRELNDKQRWVFNAKNVEGGIEAAFATFVRWSAYEPGDSDMPPSKVRRDYATLQSLAQRMLDKLGEDHVDHALTTFFRKRYPDNQVFGALPITLHQALFDLTNFDFEPHVPLERGHESSEFDRLGATVLALIFIGIDRTVELSSLGNRRPPSPAVFTEVLRLVFTTASQMVDGPDFWSADLRRRLEDAMHGAKQICWNFD